MTKLKNGEEPSFDGRDNRLEQNVALTRSEQEGNSKGEPSSPASGWHRGGNRQGVGGVFQAHGEVQGESQKQIA